MEKNNNMKCIGSVALFIGAVAGIAIAVSHYKYSGPKVYEEYVEMCDKVQLRILQNQEKNGAFASNVVAELKRMKDEFKNASYSDRARRYVLMQREALAPSYNGIKVAMENMDEKAGKQLAFLMREKYAYLEKQLSTKWDVLSSNDASKAMWNEMVDKVNAAEAAIKEAEEAIGKV